MPEDKIPTGELPTDYDGFMVFEIHTVGSHNARDTKKVIEEAAKSLKLSFIHLHEGDGVFRFQVKSNDPISNAAHLAAFEHWLDEFVEKYGND